MFSVMPEAFAEATQPDEQEIVTKSCFLFIVLLLVKRVCPPSLNVANR